MDCFQRIRTDVLVTVFVRLSSHAAGLSAMIHVMTFLKTAGVLGRVGLPSADLLPPSESDMFPCALFQAAGLSAMIHGMT